MEQSYIGAHISIQLLSGLFGQHDGLVDVMSFLPVHLLQVGLIQVGLVQVGLVQVGLIQVGLIQVLNSYISKFIIHVRIIWVNCVWTSISVKEIPGSKSCIWVINIQALSQHSLLCDADQQYATSTIIWKQEQQICN